MCDKMHGTKHDLFDGRLGHPQEHREEQPQAHPEEPTLSIMAAPATPMERHLIVVPAQAASSKATIYAKWGNRLLDVTLAIILILLLLPVMMLTALMVFASDPGPVLFAHARIGRRGHLFPCYKFRSMYVGAEQRLADLVAANPELGRQWAEGQKLRRDPRVTPIGRILRVYCLDELPQLFNVIEGDMSLVGPRPITEGELARYGRHADAYCSVRPGLTGLWQVTRSDTTSYNRRIATDILYIRRKSLRLDCRILLMTIPAVIFGRGCF